MRDLLGGWNSVVPRRDEGPDRNGNRGNEEAGANVRNVQWPCQQFCDFYPEVWSPNQVGSRSWKTFCPLHTLYVMRILRIYLGCF